MQKLIIWKTFQKCCTFWNFENCDTCLYTLVLNLIIKPLEAASKFVGWNGKTAFSKQSAHVLAVEVTKPNPETKQ